MVEGPIPHHTSFPSLPSLTLANFVANLVNSFAQLLLAKIPCAKQLDVQKKQLAG